MEGWSGVSKGVVTEGENVQASVSSGTKGLAWTFHGVVENLVAFSGGRAVYARGPFVKFGPQVLLGQVGGLGCEMHVVAEQLAVRGVHREGAFL